MTRWPPAWEADAPGATCPRCGSTTGRPIVRGLPSGDLFEAVRSGEIDIAIGGCIVRDDDPTHRCTACGTQFTPTSQDTP